MFERVREDYDTYGRQLRNRALWGMFLYRYGRWANELELPPARWLFGKIYGAIMIFAPVITGMTLDRATRVGKRFHVIHPGMVAIHPDVEIGDRVGLMHGVTIGQNMSGGVPKIGSVVFIGTGAAILGPITVGDGARIAANSLVIADVPPGMLAMGVPAKNYPIDFGAGKKSKAAGSLGTSRSANPHVRSPGTPGEG
jgi:serine O-acetyltransferase